MSISVTIGLFYVGICMIYGDVGWKLVNWGEKEGEGGNSAV
jgi:hypothetical protein